MFDISIFRDHAFYMQVFQHLVIIADKAVLVHVADEAVIPTRVLLRRSLSPQWFSVFAQVTVSSVILLLRRLLSAQWFCYCPSYCQLSDSDTAQVTVSSVILRPSLSEAALRSVTLLPLIIVVCFQIRF